MTINGFLIYIKQLWKNFPSRDTPVTAERLIHIENGIKGNNDAIDKIAKAVISNIINDENKIASMAALYGIQQQVNQQSSDFKIGNNTAQAHFDVEYPSGVLSEMVMKLTDTSGTVYQLHIGDKIVYRSLRDGVWTVHWEK